MNITRMGFGALAVSYIASKETNLMPASNPGPKIIEISQTAAPIDLPPEPCTAKNISTSANGEAGSSLLIEVN